MTSTDRRSPGRGVPGNEFRPLTHGLSPWPAEKKTAPKSAVRHRVLAKPPLQGAHPRELLASPPGTRHPPTQRVVNRR